MISSAKRIWLKMGPGRNSNACVRWLKMLNPDTSEGSRSGVNWMRANEQSRLRASALASVVLPIPGHILDEYVPVDQQRDQQQLRGLCLADDDLGDIGLDGLGELSEVHGCLTRQMAYGKWPMTKDECDR